MYITRDYTERERERLFSDYIYARAAMFNCIDLSLYMDLILSFFFLIIHISAMEKSLEF